MSALNEILSAELSPRWLWAQVPAAWRAFADWWRAEFRDFLPAPLSGWLGSTTGPIIRLAVESDGVRIEAIAARGRLRHETTIAWSDYSLTALDHYLVRVGLRRSDAALELVLPAASFFFRAFEVPVQAQAHVHAIARQELEHRTPFLADSVHLGMVIAPRQKGSPTLTVRQTVVQHDFVVAAASRLGLSVADIHGVAPAERASEDGACSISLRPEAKREVAFGRRLIHFLLAAALAIAVLDAGFFWWRQERAVAAIEHEIAGVREQALLVRGLEQEVERIGLAFNALEKKRTSVSAADLLRETSRLLPEHSWATEWRFRDGSISMTGFSAAATELVALFEKSPLFTQASLDAPITFDAANGRERFSLVIHARSRSVVTQP
jgi:general secretion pathway protein L